MGKGKLEEDEDQKAFEEFKTKTNHKSVPWT